MPSETADAPRTPQLVCGDPARVQEIWPHVAHLVRGVIVSCGPMSATDPERKSHALG